MDLEAKIAELDGVEDFFELFEVAYDEEFIQHNRIHLLKLFHKNLAPYEVPISWDNYKAALSKAYCLLERGVKLPLAASSCANCESDCG